MIKSEEYIENIDSIFEDVKFASNSFVRLKILATLFEKPQNMKELTENTNLSYSSVSSNMHEMELKHFVYRDHNKYFLINILHKQTRVLRKTVLWKNTEMYSPLLHPSYYK